MSKTISPDLLARIKGEFTNYVPPSWDELYLKMVYLIASKSKDDKTKIGAVIVGPDNEAISFGYNGICRGVSDDVPERYCRPMKYQFFEHAERNSIYSLPRIGAMLPKGSKMYTNGTPCADCGRAIVQVGGIQEVIVHQQYEEIFRYVYDVWTDSCDSTLVQFKEAGIKHRTVDKILGVTGYVNGKIIEV